LGGAPFENNDMLICLSYEVAYRPFFRQRWRVLCEIVLAIGYRFGLHVSGLLCGTDFSKMRIVAAGCVRLCCNGFH